MAATQTERQAAHRNRKREKGLCLKNGCHKHAAPGLLYCRECLDSGNARKATRYNEAASLYNAGKWHPCLRCLKAKPLVKPSARYDPLCQADVDRINEARRLLRKANKKS